MENDYATTFTDGDEIGMFAVVGGKVSDAAKNVKMTYDGNSWTGELYDIAGATYYAYYPYESELTGDLVPSATTADGFFENVISQWEVKTDHTKYSDYTASDLMIAQATQSDDNLSFTMAHKMALVIIDMPKYTYSYTPTADGSSATSFTKSLTVKWNLHDNFAPCEMESKLRYIYNTEDFVISGTFGLNMFSQEVEFKSGTCQLLIIDGGASTTTQEIKVGDYYLNDGTIISQNETLTETQQTNLIGYVLYLGQHENDKNDYSSTGIGQAKCHGYVLASTLYYKNECKWYPNNGMKNISTVDNESTSNPTNWSGYYNTQEICKSLSELDLSSDNTKYAAKAATEIEAPSTSSGWFLPTAAQIKYANDNAQNKPSDWSSYYLWTSSESSETSKAYALMFATNTIMSNYKGPSSGYTICPFLAF